MARAGTPLPFWLRAEAQTAGRGRRGRRWQPGVGNFYASFACVGAAEAGASALRSFAAALALGDALEACGVPPAALSLKWPNDVLVEGRKISGILLEATALKTQPLLIIGIGVNLATAPSPDMLEPDAVQPIALGDMGITVTADDFLDILAPAWYHWARTLESAGFAPLRSAWLARAARLGQTITARLPSEQITGTFETLDLSGAIVLKTATGRRTVPAAEIHL